MLIFWMDFINTIYTSKNTILAEQKLLSNKNLCVFDSPNSFIPISSGTISFIRDLVFYNFCKFM